MILASIKFITVFTAIALSTGAVLAQAAPPDAANSPSQNQSTNGPAGTYDATTTQTTIAPNGVQSSTTQNFDKSQSYTSGNGVLSAHTHIETTGPATTSSSTTHSSSQSSSQGENP
jgi:hypothetical protein